MPKKVRELKQMLRKTGFIQKPGKGSHTNWVHSLYSGKITVSGKDSEDAKLYQEKEVKQAIQEVKRKRENGTN
ncbi:type II toxin-antitoxin system HicA family toxin [Crocosphaera sp. UHCC 0190]|uniref:type II toxin-antitoxin system HicA family toxin n=1 Tax=Crocosphaera sp. UHCC 0190 TaxID=3110246 RepID=UPI002B21D01B|nr:type II toxin-antitoxin system HicA family toxin [Crocosphaera sp. UHCC 0190]MEA5511213.1 type II toxin-antitoxin system HicA family toxin [Crocosphaera sp. UHCC 0190]